MKRCFGPPESEYHRFPLQKLLHLSSMDYGSRFTTSQGIYIADVWRIFEKEGSAIAILDNAKLLDSQGRDWVTQSSALCVSPEIFINPSTLVSMIGDHQAFYVPLPRACSLFFEKKK